MDDGDYDELLSRLGGRSLIQFCVGTGVRLDLSGEPHYEITVESPLSISGAAIDLAQPTSTEVLAALRDLLMQTVRSVTQAGGQLKVAFESSTITVPVDDQYEAWQIRADDETLIVSMPGGKLSGWLPR